MTEENVTKVARHFSDYINRVSLKGERFVLMRGNKPVAELRPVPVGRTLSDLPKILTSLPHLGTEGADEFERDLNAARSELERLSVRDPWER